MAVRRTSFGKDVIRGGVVFAGAFINVGIIPWIERDFFQVRPVPVLGVAGLYDQLLQTAAAAWEEAVIDFKGRRA